MAGIEQIGCEFELDKRFSTTRRVIKKHTFSSKSTNGKLLGGMRTHGYAKIGSPDKPLISVITVVCNGAEYIESAIQSVIHQS